MGAVATKHADDELYEQKVDNYEFLAEGRYKTVDRPRRLRLNPTIAPCPRGQCESPAQYLEFKEWMTKEWAVYCSQIKYMQSQLDECFQKHGMDAKRHCGPLVTEYMETVSDEALSAARK